MEQFDLHGLSVVVAGGDKRETILGKQLARWGAKVWYYGPDEAYPGLIPGLPEKCDIIIIPLAGVNEQGFVYSARTETPVSFTEMIHLLKNGAAVIGGNLPETWKKELQRRGCHYINAMQDDELAILNAIPTAEGAVLVAMQEGETTLNGSRTLVTGFGRCGLPLCRVLSGMGARVSVAARRPPALAMARALGFETVTFGELPGVIHLYDYVFNTVPAVIIDGPLLAKMKKDAVIIDIASAPGGVDFDMAKKLGIKAVLATGLPGKRAPVSAGLILAKVYGRILTTLRKEEEEHEA